jgi:predicted DNA-binding antitoxin AbrB/MazE fold protein
MVQVTEAVYTNGVLKPTDELGLQESQRVLIIVESLDDSTARADRAAALQRLLAGIERMRFFSGGSLPSRDELHDRP